MRRGTKRIGRRERREGRREGGRTYRQEGLGGQVVCVGLVIIFFEKGGKTTEVKVAAGARVDLRGGREGGREGGLSK